MILECLEQEVETEDFLVLMEKFSVKCPECKKKVPFGKTYKIDGKNVCFNYCLGEYIKKQREEYLG